MQAFKRNVRQRETILTEAVYSDVSFTFVLVLGINIRHIPTTGLQQHSSSGERVQHRHCEPGDEEVSVQNYRFV